VPRHGQARLIQWAGLLAFWYAFKAHPVGCNAKASGFTNAANAQANSTIAPRLKRRGRIVAGID
jgi:hypothetical protein